ncbi:MAG: hypothetical protein CBB97_21385 [Candidatus Endolissoclinum sp. TMED37]|nr:MAG: hypothetical protein CBB97_21385 [Candidatus Endolissoclinum sp. TMED37]
MNMTVVRRFNTGDLHQIAKTISPVSVGFDRMFQHLHTVAEHTNNYPPYNIIKEDDKYQIELAAAGFTQEELTITHKPDGNELVIEGVKNDIDDSKFVHRGIGARNFTKTFVLNNDIQVVGADFVDGMLCISLEHIIPEERQPKQIKIGN